jgi:glutathione S-transferase
MPAYKLTYFEFRARGEVPRLLFAAAGVDYEDIRHDYTNWPPSPSAKDELPFGQLPTLTVDGVVYCQSVSIARYLAEKFGLAGKTDEEKLKADMIVHCVEDVVRLIIDILHEENPEPKAKLLKKFKEEQFPQSNGHFEKLLTQNNGGDGYLVGDSLTWADVTVFNHLTGYVNMAGIEASDFIDAYPKLKALVERVGKNLGIAAWIAKRPETAI